MASTVRNTSNTVTTLITHAQISNVDGGFVKAVNTNYADIGDSLIYTITMKNTGNTTATSIVLIDTIPSGTSFISNSVVLNGNSVGGANPQNGISIGSLAPNQVSTVVFKVTVNTIPSLNPIPNNSILNYSYTMDPSVPNGQNASSISNTVNTQVNHGEISTKAGGFNKSVDKNFADIGDKITYTVAIKNTGNISVNNVQLIDTIPNGTTFVPGSVLVNGVATGGGNPQTGINIGSINAGEVVTVSFNVTVSTIPSVNPIPNQGKINYSYTVNPANPNGKAQSGLSNIVTTQINSANFNNANKTATPKYADIGSTVTYAVGLKNNGNVVANNVTFTDTIPSGTSFIQNSVTINGTNTPGTNPETGINVGSINPGATVTVAFNVLVTSIPAVNPIINQGTVGYTYTVDPANPDGGKGSSSTSQSSNQINSALLNPANGSIVKTVDKQYASIGDTLTYGLNIKNLGNTTINNLVVSDTVPSEITVVNGSISVNGVIQPGGNLSGITIGNVPPQGTMSVTFKATVNTIPATGKVTNNFLASYSYTVDPAKPNGVTKQTLSNNVTTTINDAVIGKGPNSFSKTVSKAYADIGDTLTYTILLSNTGNVPGENVVVTDVLPNGLAIVQNSLTLNGNPISQNIQSGINIGTLNPGAQAVLAFQAIVNTIPNPNPIKNTANVSYTYTKDPSMPNGESVKGSSTGAQTQINHGQVPAEGFQKTGDKTIVKRGDVITYTVTVPNSGNVTITNVVFTDPLPEGTSLVPNSVIVNGVLQPSGNPSSGVSLGSIAPNDIETIQFKVVVNTIPASGSVINQGSISYQYIVDPSLPPKVVTGNTNTSNILIRDASINYLDGGFTKAVDKAYAQLDDTLTYSFTLKNTGNVTATNIVFTDILDKNLVYNNGSVIVGGVKQPNANPSNGIIIAFIAPNQSVQVSFTADIVDIPANKEILDSGNVTFNFIQDPTKPPVQGAGKSNTVKTLVNSTDFTGDNFKKLNEPYYVTLGDTIKYSFHINNAGNITAQNTVFTDSLPYGLGFVPDSLYIDGVNAKGKNPVTGVELGDIGINVPITVDFKAVVLTLPKVNPVPNKGKLKFKSQITPDSPTVIGDVYSNEVLNQVNTPNLSIQKTSYPDAIAVGDTIKYILVVKNNGNVTAQNVVINDPLAPQVSYVDHSLQINGVSLPDADIVSGVSIDDVSVGETVTITFNAVVITNPDNGVVTNKANSNYEFIVDPNNAPVEGNTSSNGLDVKTFVAELTLSKKADTETAILNQEITYTVKIVNTGNITATNIIFRDELPDELEFVQNSFYLNKQKINGVELDLGINIGNLAPNQMATITYKAKLVKVCCDGVATNKAFATFKYKATNSSPEMTKIAGPVSAKVTTASSTFKEICIDGVLVVPCPKLDIEEVNELNASVEITNYHVIKTVKGVSDENRRLTGYKLIINGLLTQNLEYTANDTVQSVHSAYFERKFSTFIVLPEDFKIGTSVRVSGTVEDIYYSELNSREVFSNATILIDAVVLC